MGIYPTFVGINVRGIRDCLNREIFKPAITYFQSIIGMYLHGFVEKLILPYINKRSSLGEKWEQTEV